MLAEMAVLQPLLAGEDTADQLVQIMELLGMPDKQEVEAMGVEDVVLAAAMGVVRVASDDVTTPSGVRIVSLVGPEYPGLGELVTQLLRFDPGQRTTARELLENQFLTQTRSRSVER